jgi:hypothetical protein
MFRKFALLTVALTLAIPAVADTKSNLPVLQKASVTKPSKPGKPPGKGHNNQSNQGQPSPCGPVTFNTKQNATGPCAGR